MEFPVIGKLRQSIEHVEQARKSVWATVLTYVGATEDSSLWWKAVFERRLLKGDVGVSIRWFHSKKVDVLWEMESLVKSLSQESNWSPEMVRPSMNAVKTPSTLAQRRTRQDSNVNNEWLTDRARERSLRLRKYKSNKYNDCTKRREEKRWFRKTAKKYQDTSYDQYQLSADYTGNSFSDMETIVDVNSQRGGRQRYVSDHTKSWFDVVSTCGGTRPRRCTSCPPERRQKSVSERRKPRFDVSAFDGVRLHRSTCCPPERRQKSVSERTKSRLNVVSAFDGVRLHRSASCPDIEYFSHDVIIGTSVNVSKGPCISTRIPYRYSQDDHFENLISRKQSAVDNILKSSGSQADFYWDQDVTDICYSSGVNMYGGTEEDASQICQNDLSLYTPRSLEELLLQQNALNALWEDDDLSFMGTEDHSLIADTISENQSIISDKGLEHTGNNNCEENASLKICYSNTSSINTHSDEHVDFLTRVTSLGETSRMHHGALRETDQSNKITTNIINNLNLDRKQNEYTSEIKWNTFIYDAKNSGRSLAASDYRSNMPALLSPTLDTLKNAAAPNDPDTVDMTSASSVNSSQSCEDSTCTYRERFVTSLHNSVESQGNRQSTVEGLSSKGNQQTNTIAVSVDTTRKSSVKPSRKSTQVANLSNSKNQEEDERNDILQPVKFDVFVKTPDVAHAKTTILRRQGLQSAVDPSRSAIETEGDYCGEARSWLSRSAWASLTFVQQSLRWLMHLLVATPNEEHTTPVNSQYVLQTPTEAKYEIARLHTEWNYFTRLYKWKQETLMNIVRIARNYYSDPTEMNLARWKSLKQKLSRQHESYTDVRVQVSNIPDYFPYFTFALAVTQIIIMCILCKKFGFSEFGMTTEIKVRGGIPTFLGTETIRFMKDSNPWLGPPVHYYIDAGAVMASCMRPLEQLKIITARKGYRLMTKKNQFYFGCCESPPRLNMAGTSTQLECQEETTGLGKWTMGVICSNRSSTKNSVAHVIRPCCVGYWGECVMVSHEHCRFIEGVFHTHADHCVQVNCLQHLCQLAVHSDNDTISVEGDAPWLPRLSTQWQWWRYLTAIPLSYGIIHLAVVIFLELTIMLRLEMCAGWHRVILIYVGSAIIGEIVADSLEPFVPHVGATSGIGGIIGVAVLELFQAWTFLQYPLWEAIKLLTVITFVSFLGTFYLISIAAFLSGIIVGAILCLVFIPYITYGRRLGFFRARLVLTGFVLMLLLLGTLQWALSLLELCNICRTFECMPYTSGLCITYFQNAQKISI